MAPTRRPIENSAIPLETRMVADSVHPNDRATIFLMFPGWRWHSYTGIAPAALVALDSQVFFPGDVAKGFRFELSATPGTHSLTVILGSNSRTITMDLEAGKVYEIPLRFGGRWGAMKIDFPEAAVPEDAVSEDAVPETLPLA
jgi:hypothetical protein